MQNTQKKGFTLIELLVVIAIIGILSAIGLVSLNGAREKARDAQAKSDLATFRTSLQLYYDDHNNTYPGNVVVGTEDSSNTSAASGATADSIWTVDGPVIVEYLAGMKSPHATRKYEYRASNFVLGASSSAGAFVVSYNMEGAGGGLYYSVDNNGNVKDVADAKTVITACDIDTSATVFDGSCLQ